MSSLFQRNVNSSLVRHRRAQKYQQIGQELKSRRQTWPPSSCRWRSAEHSLSVGFTRRAAVIITRICNDGPKHPSHRWQECVGLPGAEGRLWLVCRRRWCVISLAWHGTLLTSDPAGALPPTASHPHELLWPLQLWSGLWLNINDTLMQMQPLNYMDFFILQPNYTTPEHGVWFITNTKTSSLISLRWEWIFVLVCSACPIFSVKCSGLLKIARHSLQSHILHFLKCLMFCEIIPFYFWQRGLWCLD